MPPRGCQRLLLVAPRCNPKGRRSASTSFRSATAASVPSKGGRGENSNDCPTTTGALRAAIFSFTATYMRGVSNIAVIRNRPHDDQGETTAHGSLPLQPACGDAANRDCLTMRRRWRRRTVSKGERRPAAGVAFARPSANEYGLTIRSSVRPRDSRRVALRRKP
jgi:hypothetical protein